MINKCKKLTKSPTATVIEAKYENTIDRLLELHGINYSDGKIILFKRVSKDLKTQENTKNETTWGIGQKLMVPNWNPTEECGEGKFHACPQTFFCDEFRSEVGDRYVMLEVEKKDLYTHLNPSYPHKIAFREGVVIAEVDRDGNKI